MADPHINEGVNKSRESPVGLYKITLDDRGKQISCSLAGEDAHQVPKCLAKEVTQELTLRANVGWYYFL